MGGYGSAVGELFTDLRITTPMVRIGWPDEFVEHASTVDWLREKHGLTAAGAVAEVKATLAAKQPAERRLVAVA
jgi:1-deoxy-D-xylulose-5-phosphate synthase